MVKDNFESKKEIIMDEKKNIKEFLEKITYYLKEKVMDDQLSDNEKINKFIYRRQITHERFCLFQGKMLISFL